jgi:hypothetical protein
VPLVAPTVLVVARLTLEVAAMMGFVAVKLLLVVEISRRSNC